jgi:hypothetical protein
MATLGVLLSLSPKVEPDVLIIEDSSGQHSELKLSDIAQKEGIDCKKVSDETMLNFHDKYSKDKADTFLKAFYLNDIIDRSDYKLLTFNSADGATVIIEPKPDRDNLILLTLEKNQDNLSLRLIMPEDSFSQRWLKNVVRIYIE